MKRGEIWTLSGGPGYAGKPRPALILQSDLLSETDSVVICPFTTHESKAIPTRVAIQASEASGLLEDSDAMADKIMAVARSKLGRQIGTASPADIMRVQEAVLVVLGVEA